MAKKKGVVVTNELVLGLAKVVELLPRNMNNKANPPEPFKGVIQPAVEPTFYNVMKIQKHDLAEVDNADCTIENRCGECRRDMLVACAEEAQKRGLLVRIHRAKWDVYFTPAEMRSPHAVRNEEVAAKVVEELAAV